MMNLLRTSGILLVAGFVLVIIASFVGPNAVYTAPDSETRLAIIAENQGRWTATNLIWAAGSVVTAIGALLLTLGLRQSQTSWPLDAGAAAFMIGMIAWAIYLYQRIGDPAGNLYTTPPALLSLVFAWATIVGLALYGVAFLQGSFPNWLGYVLLVTQGLLVLGLVFFFDAVYASFPPQFFSLLTLVVGIVALRR
jgi:hypothetical protein